MTFRIPPLSKKITLIFAGIVLSLALLGFASRFVQSITSSLELPYAINYLMGVLVDLFNVNGEASVPTWFSSVMLLICAGLIAIIAWMKKVEQERYTRYWSVLAIIFLYLSIDEVAEIHEKLAPPLREFFGATGFLYFSWVIAGAPLVIIFALVYLRFLFHLPPRTRNLFILAGVLYVGGAIVVESIWAYMWYNGNGSGTPYLIKSVIEEVLEMSGIVVFIYSLLTFIDLGAWQIQFIPNETTSIADDAIHRQE